MRTRNRRWLVLISLLGCSPGKDLRTSNDTDAGIQPQPQPQPQPEDAGSSLPSGPVVKPGDILDTTLELDLSTNAGVATLKLVPSSEPQSFEVGDLEIRNVHIAGVPLAWSRRGTFL